MNQNWIQGDIDGTMGTSSSTSTPERNSPIEKRIIRRHLPKLTPWEPVQQMLGGNQVNDMTGKR